VRRFAAAAAVVGFFDTSTVWAQNPEVIATYRGLDAKANFSFKMKGESYAKPVGLLNWDVPQEQFGTAGLDRAFKAYCAEPLVGVTAGNTYRFDILSPDEPPSYNLPDTEAGRKEAKLRGTYIRELFGRHYLTSLDANTPDAARGFQVALWELAYETELPAGFDPAQAKFDLTTGTFQSDYPKAADAPAFVGTAQTYLKSLTGNDAVFYGPGLEGRELVRLNGLANAAGVTAQDQYVLRATIGGPGTTAGVGGSGGVGGLGGLGGVGGIGPIGGGGGLGGGLGGGGGGIGGAFGGSNGNGAVSPTAVVPPSAISTTPLTPPTTSFSPPPVNADVPPGPPPPVSPGGSPPGGSPPGGGGDSPNPVPGPSGVILGGIAALALAGRRAMGRWTAKK